MIDLRHPLRQLLAILGDLAAIVNAALIGLIFGAGPRFRAFVARFIHRPHASTIDEALVARIEALEARIKDCPACLQNALDDGVGKAALQVSDRAAAALGVAEANARKIHERMDREHEAMRAEVTRLSEQVDVLLGLAGIRED